MDRSADSGGWAYFTITSSLPLSAIVEHMGADGERRSWSIGDARPGSMSAHAYTFSRWSLQSDVNRGRPLDEHLRALWRRLSPLRSAILSLPPEMKGEVECVAHFGSRDDALMIAAGHFATAAYYQIVIDCDFYFDDGFGDAEEGRAYWDWEA